MQVYLEQLTATTMPEHGFAPEGTPPAETDYGGQRLITLPPAQVAAALQTCSPAAEWLEEMQSNPAPYEDPDHTVLVAIDEVGEKQQTAPRGERAGSPAQPAATEGHRTQ